MKTHFKFLAPTIIVAALLLAACGGGGGDSSSSSSTSTVSLNTPAGTSCLSGDNSDVFGNMQFINVNNIGSKPWGCLIVNKADNQPVAGGNQSVRFELRPGDCSASSTFDDCSQNRGRTELQEANSSPNQGQTITYNTNVYIPGQSNLYSPQSLNVDLMQLNYIATSGSSLASYGGLAALQIDKSGSLVLQTYSDVSGSFVQNQKYVISANPMNQWFNIRYEVKASTSGDGYVRIFVNGAQIVNESHVTLPSSQASVILKFGIYDVFTPGGKSADTHVVYFDGFSKQVSN